MKKFLLSFVAIVFAVTQVWAQQRTISGKVTSVEDGSALPGVNVIVKGTTSGSVTDIDGNYTISVPSDGGTLVFSFIGLTTEEVVIGSRSVIDLAMSPDVTQLSEVIVTAYGTSTKRDFTGSASTVSAETFELRPVTNPIAAIEGNATGVQFITPSGAPGSSPSIVIRGVGTFNDFDGATDPLIILDGIQFDGTLALINQDDIESMTVLKDAASTSLYGSRAANGVVIITTKSGKKGRPTQVSYSGQFGLIDRGIDLYEATNPQQYYEVMWEAYKNTLNVADPEAEASASIFNRLGYNPFDVPNDQIVGTDGRINPNAQLRYPSLNWFDVLERQGTRQNHSVTVAGGTDNSTIFFSTGYLNEKGYIIESEFERITTRLKADFDVKDWLTLGANVNLSLSDQTGVAGANTGSIVNPFGFAKNMGAIYPVYLIDDATGQIVTDAAGNRLFDRGEGYPEFGISPRPTNPGRHAIEEAFLNDILDRENGYGLRAYAEISIPWVDGLKAKITYGRDYQDRIRKDYENEQVGDAQPVGRYQEIRSRRIIENFTQLLTYKKTINDDHNLDFTLGHESFDREFSFSDVFVSTQVAQGIFEFDNFSVPLDVEGATTDKGIESYFARLNYNYKNKYYLSMSGRRDGSSIFQSGVRWGNFYSLGGSWRISEEPFLSDVSFLSDLKLRASWGEVGNDNLGDFYASQARYSLTSNGGSPAIFWADLGNQDLVWETIENFDVALEFGLLNDRINGTLEYYRRNSTDLLFDRPIALVNGLRIIPDNVADIVNDGFEVSLTGNILSNPGGLNWDMTVLATTLNNEITSIPAPVQNGSKRWDLGRSRYDFYIYHTAGVDPETGDQLYYVFEPDEETGNSRPALDAEGNQLTTTDWRDSERGWADEKSLPDMIGSVSNTFSYKGLSLNVLFTFSQGGKVLDNGYSAMMGPGAFGVSHHVDQLRAWREPGDITDVPRLQNGSATQVQTQSTRFLTDASFIALRNVSLSYNFSPEILDNLGLNRLNVFLSGENLFINAERPGLNPQFNLAGTGSGNGYNPNRIFTMGVNIGL